MSNPLADFTHFAKGDWICAVDGQGRQVDKWIRRYFEHVSVDGRWFGLVETPSFVTRDGHPMMPVRAAGGQRTPTRIGAGWFRHATAEERTKILAYVEAAPPTECP